VFGRLNSVELLIELFGMYYKAKLQQLTATELYSC